MLSRGYHRAMEKTTEPNLDIGRYRLLFTTAGVVQARPRQVLGWRGAFGNQLKNLCCPMAAKTCNGCMFKEGCIYNYLFETPPPPGAKRMKSYPSVPHPYVFTVPADREKENCYVVEFVLVGKARQHLGTVVKALVQTAARGGGMGEVRMHQQGMEYWSFTGKRWQSLSDVIPNDDQAVVPPCPDKILLQILSPLCLKYTPEGYDKAVSIKADEMEFHHLFRNLLRRISSFSYFHMNKELVTDFAGLNRASKLVSFLEKNLHQEKWQRYSTRQQQNIYMKGIVGSLYLDGKDLSPFWPYLWLGQWVHAGKWASMGMGRYQLYEAKEIL